MTGQMILQSTALAATDDDSALSELLEDLAREHARLIYRIAYCAITTMPKMLPRKFFCELCGRSTNSVTCRNPRPGSQGLLGAVQCRAPVPGPAGRSSILKRSPGSYAPQSLTQRGWHLENKCRSCCSKC